MLVNQVEITHQSTDSPKVDMSEVIRQITTISHLRNPSRGELQREVIVNSGEACLPLCAPGSRGKTDVMRSDKSDATAENGAEDSTQKFSNEPFRQHPRVPFHREFPTVECREPRCEPCSQTRNPQCSTLASSAHLSGQNLLSGHLPGGTGLWW